MPLLGSGAILGALIATAGGCNPAGAVLAGGLGNAMATWLPANCISIFGTMTAAGAAVTGLGLLTFIGTAPSFGAVLAQSVGATDAAGIAKWTTIASSLMNHITLYGRVVPVAFVAVPAGGAVTGVGAITFLNLVFAPPLSTVLGLTDAANVVSWFAIGTQMLTHIALNAQALSLGYTSPPGGGLLVGASTLL